jgi:hypothetical protein
LCQSAGASSIQISVQTEWQQFLWRAFFNNQRTTMGRSAKRRRRCSSNEQDDDSLALMPLLKTARLAPNDSKISSGVTLHRRLRDDNTLQHSILLGDLVAVQAHDHDPPSWPVPLTTFPYSSGWRLAQVVAFDEDNVSVRWFRSLSKTDVVWQHLVGPKKPWRAAVLQVTELDPHLVFEDDVTATVPVSLVLPAFITMLPSSARGQSPEPYFDEEDIAWHIFCKCTHRLVQQAQHNWTLERCRDWDSYSDAVATATTVPAPLLRAWQSSMSAMQQQAFQNRPMTTPRLQINRLEVDPATVQPCSAPVYQCSVTEAKGKKVLEFFTGLEWPWDGSHWANCPNGTPRRRSVLTVGQVVALRAPPFANHPTHPFVVPWSAAQVVALYRKDTYFLQVRWLCPWANAPAEARQAAGWSQADAWTQSQQQVERHFLEVNHVAHDIPLSHVLGRVVTHGSAASDEVPIVVRYALDNDQVRTVSGWSLTTKQLPAPLSRGLLAPDSFTAQHATLRAAYEAYSRQIHGVRTTAVTLQQGQWTDLVHDEEEEENALSCHSTWPRDLLLPSPLVPSSSPDYILWRAPATGPTFFHRLDVVTRPQRCHCRVTGKKGSPPVSWTVQLGDVVCLAVASGTPPQTNDQSPWFPFVGPWRLAQVLAIYQSDNDDLRLEVRWLYRQSDLPRRVHGWMPTTNDSEVFETDDVVNDVPADWILGRVQLALLPTAAPMPTDGVPLVRARCRFYYAQERFQPLSAWQQNIQRGCQLSRHAARHPELAAAMAERFSWPEPMTTTSTVPDAAPVLFTRSVQGQNVDFFVTAWVPFCSDRYLDRTLRGGLDHEWPRFWQLAVGDVVAAKLESTTDSAPGEVYRPFAQPWRACQILSLSRSADGVLRVEVRALRTHFDDMDSGLPHVYETKEAVVQTLAQEDLYGPLTLLLGSDPQKFDHVWRQGSDPKPPIAPCLYQGMFCLEMNAPIARSERIIDGLLKRGIAYSNEYQPSEVPLVVQSGRRQVRVFNSPEYDTGEESVVEDFEDEESEGVQTEAEDRCSLTTPPFHIDRSSRSKYYSSLSVCPPYDDYATVVPSDVLESPPVWTVKLGDMVIVRSSDSFAGPATYLGSALKKSRYFPMTECWGIAEVVTIRECCSQKNDSSETSVEIRWFYRHAELPVSLRKSVHPAKSPFSCEEVYESDHYDEVEPESLLAPAVLYAQSSRVQENHSVIGMPVLEFVCHQAFSLSRNSWVPSGDLSGRIGRSRANSGLIRKDPALKLALAQLGEAGLPTNREKVIPQSRKDAFRSVLAKLSITDASKEASVKSTALVGREKERGEVLKFLKDAVAGVARDNKSAMFIAGPPVRSSSRETMFKLWPNLTIAFILLGSWENGVCKGNDQ